MERTISRNFAKKNFLRNTVEVLLLPLKAESLAHFASLVPVCAVYVLANLAGKTGLRGIKQVAETWKFSIRLPSGRGTTFVCHDVREVSNILFGHQEEVEVAREAPPGSVIIDVGAHVGFQTTQWAKDHPVLSVEPIPRHCAIIRENLAVNNRRAHLTQKAAWFRKESLRMLDMGASSEISRKGNVPVEADTLDSMLRGAGLNPANVGLVKIDAEGAEAEVLAGAKEILRLSLPLVIFEALSEENFGKVESILEMRHGYRLAEQLSEHVFLARPEGR